MSKRRLSRTDSLRFVLPRILTFLLAATLLLGFGWYTVAHGNRDMEGCLRAYDRARTPADSAAVDDIRPTGRMNGHSCGGLRRNGTLERHRAAMERRVAQDRRTGGLTEK